ncbi:MAG TPA: hypothetical protein DEP53_00920 [Bacteroidetes bacterium]|nr:hypothetical protein [Bacteroidota bacterium]
MKTHWTQQDILDLIKNQIEESLNLEYKAADALDKSSDSKKREIAKDVSAMANSDGGTIVYGIREYGDATRRHLAERIDPINRTNASKEWLEQILGTNVFPRISNITIEPIPIGESPTDVIYVVTIPKSDTAHQASDKRYYKRFNFQSVAMYDYEIRDILNRSQNPVIDIEFAIERETYEVRSSVPEIPVLGSGRREPEFRTDIELLVFAYNNGRVLAKYVNCHLEVPESVLLSDEHPDPDVFEKDGVRYVKRNRDNTERDVVRIGGQGAFSYPNYGPARYFPILPKTRTSLSTNLRKRILLNTDLQFYDRKIFWTVNADNAEPIAGECFLRDITIKDKPVH